jgi:DNA-directed RNA polymerase subunit M/transcription elongation factor TFIIS
VIRCFCPSCSHVIDVPDSEAGTNRPCDLCGQRLQVPTPPRNRTVLAGLSPPENVPVLEEVRRRRKRRRGFRCPWCGSRELPLTQTQVSGAGWAFFAVGLVVFFPIAFLGFAFRETVRRCADCGRVVRPTGL